MFETKILFGIKHLATSEQEVAATTRNTLMGVYKQYPQIADVLIKLIYFTGQLESPETQEGALQSFCHVHYAQAPYTFWVIHDLYEKGYYLETLILYRHLLEAFIQMKYFKKYPEKLKNHVLKTNRIRFKTMFDEFSIGYYDKYYGQWLSGAAHGDVIVKDIFRNERGTPQDTRAIMGCEFNMNHATYVMNSVTALFYGYLHLFEYFFHKNTIVEDEIFKKVLTDSKTWLESSMIAHKKANNKSINWYKHMDKFIRLPELATNKANPHEGTGYRKT